MKVNYDLLWRLFAALGCIGVSVIISQTVFNVWLYAGGLAGGISFALSVAYKAEKMNQHHEQ